jgi:hypothetical protein
MGLSLETDTDVFDGAGEDRVGDTREATGEVVLAVAEAAIGIFLFVQFL